MINTFQSAMYLKEDVDELIELKYTENEEIKKILEEFSIDLTLIHKFTRKVVDFENEKIDNKKLREAYNAYRAAKSINLTGGVV